MLYENEKNLWVLNKSITNSAGNLCLHLVGNLNHFIGAVIGNTGYERQRSQEFSLKDVPRDVLLAQINNTILVVENTLKTIKVADLDDLYPIEVSNEPMTAEYFLTHLVHHLSYHLGQINYHRRLFDA